MAYLIFICLDNEGMECSTSACSESEGNWSSWCWETEQRHHCSTFELLLFLACSLCIWYWHCLVDIWCSDGVTTGFHSNESSDFRPSQSRLYDILLGSWLSSVSCFVVFCMSDMAILCWFHSVVSALSYCLHLCSYNWLLFVVALYIIYGSLSVLAFDSEEVYQMENVVF